ncbi:hypothetical protein H072_386 [Dactylellina haptotyla CBS 200.50]|uniref:Mid2 domain-containing protein n=1 Tax=Dactylellina haptotyla (strain CBS 200.50) TaxID=1284197 RepID=S8C1K8_DACHA|nr:hypothetical protein H072_386 [Dactylellina haptotyla CBS 200.50]
MPSLRNPLRISYILLSFLLLSSFSNAESLKLTTAPPIPTSWTVSANCFSPVAAVDNNSETIWNMGCGKTIRRSCCPPSWDIRVIFEAQTNTPTTVPRKTDACPNGYLDQVVWGDLTSTPETAGTKICCPSGITYWSTFGASGDPLCYTQTPFARSTGGVRLSDPYWVSTYARAFFIAEQAVIGSPTSTSVPASTTASMTGSTTAATTGSSSQVVGTTAGNQVTETPGTPSGGDSKSGLGSGAIAGIVVGIVVPIILGVVAFIIWRRRRVLGMTMHMGSKEDPPVPPPAGSSDFYPLKDSSENSAGYFRTPPAETSYYGHNKYIISESALEGSTAGNSNMESQDRRIARFENAEKVPEQNKNEELRFGGHYS